MNVVAIINPLSGAGADPGAAASRAARIDAYASRAGAVATIHVTERPHHARDLAASAVASSADLVVVWGGDGTINEVGSILAGTGVPLGIVPAGSGNGLANELGIPHDSEAALAIAFGRTERAIDVGDLNGRSFFNIAGIGFDATVARRFNARALGRRGLGPYVRIGLHEAVRYRASRYRVQLDDESWSCQALMIVFANGREYGNGMRLAPSALLDDGRLVAVVVDDRSVVGRLWSGRHLMLGTAQRAARVAFRTIVGGRIECDEPMVFHVDGETADGGHAIAVSIRPRALRVRTSEGASR